MTDAQSLAFIVKDLAKYVPHERTCALFAPVEWARSIAGIRVQQYDVAPCTCGRDEFVAHMVREADRIVGWST